MRKISKPELEQILELVGKAEEGQAFSDIHELFPEIPRRTLLDHLNRLITQGRLNRKGQRRAARYYSVKEPSSEKTNKTDSERSLCLSSQGKLIQEAVSISNRKPVAYNRTYLSEYKPNQSFYLSKTEREHLNKLGGGESSKLPIGTYARDILSRLLIDLSWNSSRLEGNTYSLLDTARLIELGEFAEGHDVVETTMILNHKEAIEFIVENIGSVSLEPSCILNLHAILSQELLPDPAASGRLRRMPVSIGGSVFQPLSTPQIIEECFTDLLSKARLISDPFESSFFLMVHLPYLQPFDDVNKPVSRLASNIPLLQASLAPVSFVDVPQKEYVKGILGVYEQTRHELLRDIFIWAYERSARKYAAQRQSIGEPDPFRLKYRSQLKKLLGEVIRSRLDRKSAGAFIKNWINQKIAAPDKVRFQELAESELLNVRESNFARYRVKPSEYHAWQLSWSQQDK